MHAFSGEIRGEGKGKAKSVSRSQHTCNALIVRNYNLNIA
jgi:hypothetical protein